MRSYALILFSLAACTTVASQSTTSAGSGSSSGSGQQPQSTDPAVLKLTPTKGIDFATVIVGESGTAQLHITNAGASDATKVADKSQSLGDFGYTGGIYPGTGGTCKATIPVGAGCTVNLTFTPTSDGTQTATLSLAYIDGQTVQHATIGLTGIGTGGGSSGGASSGSGSSSGNGASSGGGSSSGGTAGSGGVDKTVDFIGTFPATNDGQGGGVTATIGTDNAHLVTKAAADDAITLIAVIAGDATDLLIDQVVNPNGKMITDSSQIDQNTGVFGPTDYNRAYPSVGANALMIPQTPDIDTASNGLTPAGNYKFVVETSSAGVNVDVYVVHTLKTATKRHIDVNFYLSGSAGITTANAKSASSGLPDVVAKFVALWGTGPGTTCGTPAAGTLGLCIDNINYFDLPAGNQQVWGDAPGDGAAKAGFPTLSDLFMSTAGKGTGVNFFVVDDVSLSDGQGGVVNREAGLLGVDGLIPSPGAFNGTARSGSVLIIDSLPDADIDVGGTIAHEGGHYLGLFHVQESNCSVDDILDTECMTKALCTTKIGNGYLCDPSKTTCVSPPASANCDSKTTKIQTINIPNTAFQVMFWAALGTGVDQNLFSPNQILTAGRHPLIH